MGRKRKDYPTVLTLDDAVETLSHIANYEQESLLADDAEAYPLSHRSIHWLDGADADTTVELVKQTFRVIHDHLDQLYKQEGKVLQSEEELEGIKSIMVIVGEAAKKLDHYTDFFHARTGQSVRDLDEFKKLQRFYHNRVARPISERTLGHWILGLSEGKSASTPEATLKGKRSVVDLDAVKRDTAYELFNIRKEDGTRFFSPKLIRNIKLACDFGDNINSPVNDDPLYSIETWFDHQTQLASRKILTRILPKFQKILINQVPADLEPLSTLLKKAFFALMLAANSQNSNAEQSVKSSSEYFEDFLNYLQRSLESHPYEHMVVYPPQKNDPGIPVLETIEALCDALYQQQDGHQTLLHPVNDLIYDALQELRDTEETLSKRAWERLVKDEEALERLLRRHPRGPLTHILKTFEEEVPQPFDPLQQGNLPGVVYTLSDGTRCIRLPAPIVQESIDKAEINDAFKGFLRSYKKSGKMHLYINLQAKKSWRESARCTALEHLQQHADLKDAIVVVTLDKESDFYRQTGDFKGLNSAKAFLNTFKHQLGSEKSGFYFPEKVWKSLNQGFIETTLHQVHQMFFGGKNVLTQEQRRSFIEIFYLLLEPKLIEIISPNSFSLSCKDAIDVGAIATAELFLFLKLLKQEILTESDWEQINLMLYGPALLVRERTPLTIPFGRLESALRCIEAARDEWGKHTPAFDVNLPTIKIR